MVLYSLHARAAAAALCYLVFLQAHAQANTGADATTIVLTRPAAKIFDAQVIGGVRVSGVAWPATFLFFNQNGKRCTATVVGERTVLTAAHCIGDGQRGRIENDAIGQGIDITCDHHPQYASDSSADFALCWASQRIDLQARYEVISADPALTQNGRQVTLLGFGCVTSAGPDDNMSLYRGSATVTAQDTDPGEPVNWFITQGAGICFGDSGGAAFSGTAFRRIIGVNSRANIKILESWISPTATQRFLSWARVWRSAEGAVICGLHPNAMNCKQ